MTKLRGDRRMRVTSILAAAVGGFFAATAAANADAYTFTAIDVPGASFPGTDAFGINNAGQIVGYFNDIRGSHGFLDTGGRFATIDVPGPEATSANGINNAGQIVGLFSRNTSTHGFVDTNGSFTPIDVPGKNFTVANGINDAGQIVGEFADENFDYHGFFYFDGNFAEIDVPGAVDTFASGINDAGHVVGEFEVVEPGHLFISHGFLATPISAVPEPSSLALLFGVGVIGLGIICRRKHRMAAEPCRGR
jgi:probable HAF family extracellular repeat protein